MNTIHDVESAMLKHWPSDLPSWPDPHDAQMPADEEYSRVTNGQRYAIVVERARAWTTACVEVLGAQVSPIGPTPGDDHSRDGWTITSPRPQTTALHVAVFEYELPVVSLGCGDAREVERWPDCGCDACDSGSDDLLECIDNWFTSALTGGLAHIWGAGWSATRTDSSQGCGGDSDARTALDFDEACAQLAVIAAGGVPRLPDGLCWVWSGHWIG